MSPPRASTMVARTLVILLLTAMASGCIGPSAVRGQQAINEATYLEWEASPQRFVNVTTITVRLHVNETILFTASATNPFWTILVEPPEGERVGLYTYGEQQQVVGWQLTDVVFEPGTYEKIVHWNGRTVAGEGIDSPPHTGPRLPAGTYVINARLNSMDVRIGGETTVELAPDPDPPRPADRNGAGRYIEP